MKILLSSLLLIITLLVIMASSSFTFASTARQREFHLVNERDTSNDYHRIVYQGDNAGGTNHSICVSSGASNNVLQALCQAVGYTGFITASSQAETIDNVNYPAGIEISSCSTSESLYNFEKQCTFTANTGCTPIKLNCTSQTRNGGEYGTYVPGVQPYYLRMDYERRIQHRKPFELEWKYQCDDFVTSTTANALCTMLDGGRIARTGTITSRSVDSVSNYDWRDLTCNSGSATVSISDDCTKIESTSSITSSCSTGEGVGLYCSQHDEGVVSGNYRFRMIKSSSYRVLEVWEKTSSIYSTSGRVCDDNFGTTTDAEFFCNLLGFDSGSLSSFYSSSSGTGSSNEFLLSNMACESSFTSLTSCGFSTTPSCVRSEAVNLRCPYRNNFTLAAGPLASGSGLYIRLTNTTRQLHVATSNTESTRWYGVCEYSMSYVTSSRLCNYLGLGNRGSWDDSYLASGLTHRYYSVKCETTDANLAACTKSTSYCSPTSFNALVLPKCWNQETGVDLGTYFLRISDDGKDRLEIRSKESTTWGQIAYYASSTGSRNLCQMLGFSSSSVSYARTYGGTGRVVMKNLYCSSVKDDLASCTYSTATSDLNVETAALLSLSCGKMDNSGSSSKKKKDDDDENGALVGIIIGAVWGAIVFFAILGGIIAGCCADSDSDCECCDCCDDDEETAEQRRRRLEDEREKREEQERQEQEDRDRRQRERDDRRAERRRLRMVPAHSNDTDGSSSSSEEDETVHDRRCPVCYKVLKSESGRNNHMRAKHPGIDVPAHGTNTHHYNTGAIQMAMPSAPPAGYTYPAQGPAVVVDTNYSDNVQPPAGGYSFGVPMQEMTNMNNDNNTTSVATASYPPGTVMPNADQNMAWGVPPPQFGPSPFVPGFNNNNNNNTPYPSQPS